MSLETPKLDDLRFQDLVDEARKRIHQYCPEWSDYNVSDPGITLIELFAWMTELLTYRLNRVPEKNYIKFLELLNFQLKPARSARTELTFWLSTPISPDNQQDVEIPQGQEVRSEGSEEEAVVFTTDRRLVITWPRLTHLLKEGTEEGFVNHDFIHDLGIFTFLPFPDLKDPDKKAIIRRPEQGDTFYLGFDPTYDLKGHILRLNFSCEGAEATGISRENPPWVWECFTSQEETQDWSKISLGATADEKDTTGGLNNPDGSLVLYLPLTAAPTEIHGQRGYWVRCRLELSDPRQGSYEESPHIRNITASTIGATVVGSDAQVASREYLGLSSGEPGQEFTLQHRPVLRLVEGETLLVEEFINGTTDSTPWTYVENFAYSDRFDQHFTIDFNAGKVKLGPAVRQPDGTVKQYGRVPDSGRALYFSEYRYGGGARGNVPPNTLRTLTSSVAYVTRVTNLDRASGGRDEESLEEAKLRAAREVQAQKRAVTAQDFEQLVMDIACPARVKCLTPQAKPAQAARGSETGVVQILMVPQVAEALQAGNLQALHLKPDTIQDVLEQLDSFRLLTTQVKISEPCYLGVCVKATIVPEDFTEPVQVARLVERHLRNFLNPLVPYPEEPGLKGLLEKGWKGWPLGKSLAPAEIQAQVQRVPGVRMVMNLEVSTRTVDPATEEELQKLVKESGVQIALVPLKEKVLWLEPNTLVCSLNHQIELQALAEWKAEAR